jgi:hypothetical protein
MKKMMELEAESAGNKHIVVTTIKDALWIGCLVCNKSVKLADSGAVEDLDKLDSVKNSFKEFCVTHINCKKEKKC